MGRKRTFTPMQMPANTPLSTESGQAPRKRKIIRPRALLKARAAGLPITGGLAMCQARINAGLDVKQASRLLGVTSATLTNWEKGHYPPAEHKRARALALYASLTPTVEITEPLENPS